MKNTLLVLSAVASLLLAGCGNSKEKLHIFTWAEYIDPELVEQFETEFNCRVKIDIFDSNESMLAKIQAGAKGYDVLFPSSYMVAQLANKGIIEPLDKTKLPNLENIDPSYLTAALDPEMKYGVPYMVTYGGIAWRDDVLDFPEPPDSWNVFSDPRLKGRFTMLNDMRETLGAALKCLGYSLNSRNPAELAAARDLVISWKSSVAKFENEQYKTGIAAGEFVLVHGYSGDIGQVQLDEEGNLAEDRNHVRFFLPKEGFSLSCDELVIPVDAPNRELAYKFIDFLHRGDVAAQNLIYTTYWCPNAAAKKVLEETAPEVLENETIFPGDEVIRRGEVIDELGEDRKLYTAMWDEILSAK